MSVELKDSTTSETPLGKSASSSLCPIVVQSAPQPHPQLRFADVSPIGFAAFGLTTCLLNMRTVGAINKDKSMPMILGMGACFGGFAQVLTGLLCYLNGNRFQAVVFTSFGTFWCSFVMMEFHPTKVDEGSFAAYTFIWGLYASWFLVHSIKHRYPRVVQGLIVFVVMFIWLLSLGAIIKHSGEGHAREKASEFFTRLGGAVGVIVGLWALYISGAELNEWPLMEQPPLSTTSTTV
eukprot:m51a1_g14583 hypothetical protein (236) ;mRNA; f:1125924-1126738